MANFVGGEITTSNSSSPYSITAKSSLFGSGTYLNLGTHYYLKNSQFEIGLRVPFSTFNSLGDYVARGNTKNADVKVNGTTLPTFYQKSMLVPYTSIHFSYSYRF